VRSSEEIKTWLDKEIEEWKKEIVKEEQSNLYAPCAKYHVITFKNVKKYLFGE